jgi:hypothetical protein
VHIPSNHGFSTVVSVEGFAKPPVKVLETVLFLFLSSKMSMDLQLRRMEV